MTQAQGPPAPAAPATQGVVTPRDLAGPPVTARDVAALKARRDLLSEQLTSAASRRRDVARQLQSATGVDKAGLEQRMTVLDKRIARLESDIDLTGQQLASAASLGVAQSGSRSTGGSQVTDNMVPILIVFTIFVLCPVAIAWARAIWKRTSAPRVVVDRESTQRLERMEQAMEAIAVEIERVSEGQRFVTRLMAEGRSGAPIGAGEPGVEAVPIPRGERSRA